MSALESLDGLLDDLADRVAERLRGGPSVQASGPLPKSQAAKALGVHQTTLDRAVRAGAPFTVFNGRKRFDVAAMREWFANHRTKPDADAINVDKLAKGMGLVPARKKRSS